MLFRSLPTIALLLMASVMGLYWIVPCGIYANPLTAWTTGFGSGYCNIKLVENTRPLAAYFSPNPIDENFFRQFELLVPAKDIRVSGGSTILTVGPYRCTDPTCPIDKNIAVQSITIAAHARAFYYHDSVAPRNGDYQWLLKLPNFQDTGLRRLSAEIRAPDGSEYLIDPHIKKSMANHYYHTIIFCPSPTVITDKIICRAYYTTNDGLFLAIGFKRLDLPYWRELISLADEKASGLVVKLNHSLNLKPVN